MTPLIQLSRTEMVLAVVPEYCAGPGWSNRPVWVHIVDNADGRVRSECIQPDQQTPGMFAAFEVCNAAHRLRLGEAEKWARKAK